MRSEGVMKAVLGLCGFGFRASDMFKLGCRCWDEGSTPLPPTVILLRVSLTKIVPSLNHKGVG